MKTKAFKESYKGHELIAIWEVDANDKKVGKYPIISFGTKKAKAVLNHLKEIGEFLTKDASFGEEDIPF